MTRLCVLTLLLLVSMTAGAKVEVLLDGYIGGTIMMKSQTDNADGSTTVTITVTPNQGYTITRKGLTVVAVYSTTSQSGTRTPEIASPLKLSGPTEVIYNPNSVDYEFTVPSGLNAWMQSADFQIAKRGDRAKIINITDEGFAGTYYIASKSPKAGGTNSYTYDSANPTGNYYLCPTEGWYYYKDKNNWQTDDNSQPFLTTYNCKDDNDNYDAYKAVWIIKKHETEVNCYYIIQKKTGRYLMSNGQISGSTNANRMRVHLEKVEDESTLDDKALFEISSFPADNTLNTDHLRIKPHSSEGINGENIYLVVNNGNYNSLIGYNNQKNDGPNGPYGKYTDGIIGIFKYENNAGWALEDAIPRPTIGFNDGNNVVISYSGPNADIYYTTDGSIPTKNSTPYTDPFDPPADAVTVKAIAILNGEASNVTSIPVLVGRNRPQLIRNGDHAWNGGTPFFYMIPDTPNNLANTTSIPRPLMEWYFLNAGTDGSGNQLYYIVNASAKTEDDQDVYLYRSGNDISINTLDSPGDNGFMFYLKNSGVQYKIVPYGETAKYLKANNGNNGDNSKITLSGDDNASTNWNFVMKKDLDTSVPFEVSSYNDGVKFYKIRSNRTDGNLFYITMADSKANVSSATDEATQSWYFKEAGNDGWATYYNIVYAATGEYLYCTATQANTYGGGGSDNLTFELRPTNDERSQYIIAKSTLTDSYFIVPRLYKDAQYNNVCGILNRDDKYLRTNVTKARQITWKFEESGFTCVAPTISYDKAHDGYIITSSVPELKIYYKINGKPSISEDNLYTPGTVIPISSFHKNDVIKAFATNDNSGARKSETVTHTVYKVATPYTEIASDGSIKLVSTTTGATIYYTLDGTEPTTASAHYDFPLTDVSGKLIKAIAVKDGWIPSDVGGSGTVVTLQCATPVIKRGSNNTFTLECEFPTEGVTIYYTTNETDLTTSSSEYTAPVATSFPVTIKAIAVAEGYDNSEVSEKTITESLELEENYYLISSSGDFDIFVNMVNDDGANRNYRVTDDFSVSNPGTITKDFTGTFDGGFHIISGMSHALFNTIDGGTVKNVILKNVSIRTGENVGGIANTAKGAARIYNCGVLSGSVSGSGAVGSIVGNLAFQSSARVVNCYSYADVNGGTYAGGIVGQNNSWNEGVLQGRVALCMMYGDLSGGSTGSSPVYAGSHVNNVQNFTEYNFWRSKASVTYGTYNDQLAIDKDEYLTRFPFYRHILNTHRELAAWFLFGIAGSNVSSVTSEQVNEIGHWVLNTDIAPYPIIEAWGENTKKITEGIANNLPRTSEDYKGKLLTDFGSGGFLTVNVSINGKSYSSQLPITDMDKDKFDYTWGKVVLPFANEYEGWSRDYSKVCTGWKITSVSGGKAGSYANYNMADRDCTAKDLFSNSGYIFAQGGNYVVPYGVTAINIEAHFANAYYLSDPSYDIGYDASFNNATPLGGTVPNAYHNQTVYTDLATLGDALNSATNPHVQAIVLVGNYHYRVTVSNKVVQSIFDQDKAVTIMSCDEDNNQEPDYGWYMANTGGRMEVPPLRFDFVPIIEMGMSQRPKGSSMYPGVGIWHARGWFELTETCVSYMSQCEINDNNFNNNDDGKGNNRWIANSGYFIQIVRARDGKCEKLSYIQIGGNAYVKELYPGSHTDNGRECKSVPIVVSGGQVEECFMTGYAAKGADNVQSKLTGEMIYFWCTGGKIAKFLGAYMEEPTQAGLTAKIDHALIGRFFGGGTSAAARIKGNIDITINNSLVDFYCGGPEFGDMNEGMTVTTHATGTTFGEYYGAGFGGTSITYNREGQTTQVNISNNATTTYDQDFNLFKSKRLTNETDYGIGTCYKFEFIYNSNGSSAVSRFYTGYAQFSLATTGNIINVLTDCKIKSLAAEETVLGKKASLGDFYGAGCQGKVNGTVTSTLTNCIVEGSAYGGGYQAESNEVEVYTEDKPTYSVYTKETGIFSDFGKVPPETFTWEQGKEGKENTTVDSYGNGQGGQLYTSKDIDMSALGNVTGKITLIIGGNSKIGYDEKGKRSPEEHSGNVFGGGNESKSLDDTKVILKDNVQVGGNVFGGGNQANVTGSTTVNIQE